MKHHIFAICRRVDSLRVGGFGVGGGVVGLFDQFGKSWQHGGDLSRDRWGSGQMISGGDESVLIGGPSQSDLLAFGSDEVRSSLVGVAGFVSDGLLGVGFIAGCTVGSGVAPLAAAIFVADIGG